MDSEIHADHTGALFQPVAAASHLRRRAQKALRGQFEGMGEMVVTMQEHSLAFG